MRDDRIEYANRTFLNLLDIKSETDILKEKFLKLVAREDWEFLAENIGEMLINNEAMEIRLVTAGHKILKVKFDAMYLSDNQHFTFILIGERIIPKTVTAMVKGSRRSHLAVQQTDYRQYLRSDSGSETADRHV